MKLLVLVAVVSLLSSTEACKKRHHHHRHHPHPSSDSCENDSVERLEGRDENVEKKEVLLIHKYDPLPVLHPLPPNPLEDILRHKKEKIEAILSVKDKRRKKCNRRDPRPESSEDDSRPADSDEDCNCRRHSQRSSDNIFSK